MAVGKTADEVFGSLDPGVRAELAALITAMVRDVPTNRQTGANLPVVAPVTREAFERGRDSRVILVNAFVEARLLTTEELDHSARVRPVHEALFRTWPEAVQIIQENSELIRVRRILEPMAIERSRASVTSKDEFLIKSPSLLAAAAELDRRFGDDLSAEMRSYIADSATAEVERQNAERLYYRQLLTPTAVNLIFHFLPPAAAFVIFFLLSGRVLRELYISQLETLNSVATAFAAIGFILLSATLFQSHRTLSTIGIDLIYSRRSGSEAGTLARRLQRSTGLVLALSPWIGLAIGLLGARSHLSAVDRELVNIFNVRLLNATPHVLQISSWTIAAVALLGLVTSILLDRFRNTRLLSFSIFATILCLALFAIASAKDLDVNSLVILYRDVGPLGTLTLQLVFFTALLTLLAAMTQQSNFPLGLLIALAVVTIIIFPEYGNVAVIALGLVGLLYGIGSFLSRRYAVGAFALMLPILGTIQLYQLQIAVVAQNPPTHKLAGSVDPLAVKLQFECWLRVRGIPVDDSEADQQCPTGAEQRMTPTAAGPRARKYPVFIIAAEGGGIYAASVASMFLARLQEEASHFAEHVFALSGVSGGAIGSTIFQALEKTRDKARFGAPRFAAQKSLVQNVRAIMEDDYFSPMVGTIFPEILGATVGRAQMLVASFQLSTAERDAAAGQALARPFAQHWTYHDDAPALVLNATWVETGFRVAFAPFHLHDIDESLYSFSDAPMPNEDCLANEEKHGCVSLMGAAAVSARFPPVLPPFSTELTDGTRWNFVDGGYSDNSGATTALDLYQALQNVNTNDVDLQIVLITSSTPQPDLGGLDTYETGFGGFVGQNRVLLRGAANAAVAQACNLFYHPQVAAGPLLGNTRTKSNESCVDQGEDPTAHLHIVEIQDQAYGSALNWKISQTSLDIVSWMLGRPSECTAKRPAADASPPSTLNNSVSPSEEVVIAREDVNVSLSYAIVRRNSCIMKSIAEVY